MAVEKEDKIDEVTEEIITAIWLYTDDNFPWLDREIKQILEKAFI